MFQTAVNTNSEREFTFGFQWLYQNRRNHSWGRHHTFQSVNIFSFKINHYFSDKFHYILHNSHRIDTHIKFYFVMSFI